jgi:hypothetical protein
MMMSLDCLIGEKDVQATIERDEFETAAAPLVAQAVSARVVVVGMKDSAHLRSGCCAARPVYPVQLEGGGRREYSARWLRDTHAVSLPRNQGPCPST